MRKILKSFLVFVLLVFTSVTAPPIGVLIAFSLARAQQRKSKFAFRARLRESRTKQSCGLLNKLYFWFRRAIWPHLRRSKRTIWEYYYRPATVVFILCCAAAILLSILSLISHMNAEATSDYLSYGLWQVAITGILAVSICALAWILFSIEFAFRSVFVTLVLSAIVSGCIVCARLLAIDFFSTIFPFPPTYAPVAFGIATTLLTASLTSFVFAFLALLFEIYFLFVLGSNFKKSILINTMLVVASGLGLFSAWFATYAMFEGIGPKGQLLIVKVAEKYDFTSNHMCDAGNDEFVLYIGNVPDRAIAATFPRIGTLSFKGLAKDGVSKYMPTKFHTVRCNPIDSSVRNAGWCNKQSRFGYCQSDQSTIDSVP